ncbi:MAG: T9SS type A sorting domain-containing protein, partial [Bacteroidota bacterium]
VYIPQTFSNVILTNCKITNNSAWNGGGGIYCMRSSLNINQSSFLSVLNCSINDNLIQQTYIVAGGIFNIQVNGHGAGIFVNTSTLTTSNSVYFRNNSAYGYGRAIYIDGSRATINNCSFYKNIGYYEDLWATSGSTYNLNNVTLIGRLVTYFYSTSNITNSTIIGGGYTSSSNSQVNLDNSIWTDVDLSQFSDTSHVKVKYSILGNKLYGYNKNNVVSSNLPAYSMWLDSIANNGGITPTARLLSVTNNPARGHGNPGYLGTTDQRGAIRSDSVSVGAYQWLKPTSIAIAPHQSTLCQGDSVAFSVSVLPALVSDGSYTLTSSDNSIAHIVGTKIHALSPGIATIVVHSTVGGLSDTCKLSVSSPVGAGTLSGVTTVCQGQAAVTYSAAGLGNASSCLWTLPVGVSGSSSTNTIIVNFGSNAVSGNISVKGLNVCGEGPVSSLPITVIPLVEPAGLISGAAGVCMGQNAVTYSVLPIANALSYAWILPTGATGSSSTHSISVDFGAGSVSGTLAVKGTNSCGDGAASSKAVTVNPVYAYSENHSICNGSNYSWHGTTYASAGIYTANYTSIHGCDSIYSLNLAVNPVYAYYESHSICNGGSYSWHGTPYASAGIYTASYTSIHGCDSVYTLNLSVNPVYAYIESHSICNGSNYGWHGTTYASAGNYTASYTSIHGCDSIFTLNLSANPVYAYSENQSICNGSDYSWHGTSYASAGIYTASYTSIHGCDSIYTLNLSVNPVYAYSESHSICNGAIYSWHGTTYASAGIYTDSYTSIHGCDSTFTLSLTVNPVYAYTESYSICNGASYTWHGTVYNSAGIYTANYTSFYGCDSIYTLNLSVNPVYAYSENHSICNGASYNWHGTTYTSAGTYTASYTTLNGCDSIYTLNLSVNPVYAFSENHDICNGAGYFWHGTTYTSAGSYTANYASIQGCDSVYTLNLSVNPVYSYAESHSICYGSAYIWQGTNYNTTGTYNANYTSVYGCDSTYTLNLTVNTVDAGVSVSGLTITANAMADAYQWIDCGNNFSVLNGEVSQSFTATLNGDYAVIVTQGLCSDTSDCTQVTTVGIGSAPGGMTILLYPNPVSTQLTIESRGYTGNMTFEILNSIGQLVLKGNFSGSAMVQTSGLAPGVYLLRFVNGNSTESWKLVKE